MSDPMQRPIDPPPIDPPPTDRPATRSSPLLWLLLLVALLALGWFLYNGSRTTTVEPATPLPATSDVSAPAPATTSASAPRADRKPARSAKPAPSKKPAVAPDREPSPIARLQPEYPPAAFRSGEQGTVIVRAEIDAQGNPVKVEVANSSRSRDLDRAAVNAVRKWRFEPARKGGQLVASTVEVPIDFRLEQQ